MSTDPAVPEDTLSLRLQIARVHAGGITAQEAARRVGVTGQTWRSWEHGVYVGAAARPAMLAMISRELGVDLDWLRNGGPLRPE